jgi:alanyl-tRNA synthetase
VFLGYESLQAEASVLGLISDGQETKIAKAGQVVEVILNETSFYAESGGQDSDAGSIVGNGFDLEVLDVQKPVKGLVSHKVLVRNGEVSVGAKVTTQVDANWRLGAAQAHSATHIVHAALRQVLGPEALQSGSYNKPGYMRLDFSWAQALSFETKSEIEEISNLAIRDNLAVSAQFMSIEEARDFGAVALFGETYDESVRVIQIGGPWSRELCGGTHVSRSSQVGLVSLLGESSVGSGSRRVEALVGIEAFRSLSTERALVSRVSELLKAPRESIEEKILATLEELKSTQRKLSQIQSSQIATLVPEIIAASKLIGATRLAFKDLANVDTIDEARNLAMLLRDKLDGQPGVAAVIAIIDSKPMVVVATNQLAQSAGIHAGNLVKVASAVLGGGGGGKSDIAQGGGTDASKIDSAFDSIAAALNN